MRKCSLLVGLLVLAGCGGSGSNTNDPVGPSDPKPDPDAPLSVTLTSGDNQEGEVTTRLSDPLTVTVARDGQPVEGHVVNFVVATSEGGRAFAGSSSTDSDGRAADFWELGTLAGQHQMEVRSVDSSGNPEVWGSFTATALPGPADTIDYGSNLGSYNPGIPGVSTDLNFDSLVWVLPGNAAIVDLATIEVRAWDQYGNEIASPQPSLSADKPFMLDGSTVSVSEEHYGSVRASLDAARDSVRLLVLNDLSVFQNFSSAFTCIDGEVDDGTGGFPAIDVDSVQVELDTMLELIAPATSGVTNDTEYRLDTEGTAIAYLSDGSVEDNWYAEYTSRQFQLPDELQIVNQTRMSLATASADSVVYSLAAVDVDDQLCTFEVRLTPSGWGDPAGGYPGSNFESHGPVDIVFRP